MGEVYLAEDTRLGRKIALKLLHSELTNDERRVLRFQQEARTVSALNHPNILTIFDIGEAESTHFIATEFVKGETLRERMSSSSVDLQKVLNIIIQVASALDAAHEAGVVHRDIKPENIMVRPDGLVKVLDFGIAKLAQGASTDADSGSGPLPMVHTEPGMLMGTPKYMSPEQVRAFDVDARTDIFSLGVVLYEMLTGIAPFESATLSDTIVAILQSEPPPIAESVTGMPSGLQEIVAKTLRKDRDERYQTMDELVSDLKALERNVTSEGHSVPMWSDAPTIITKAPASTRDPQTGAEGGDTKTVRPTSSAEYVVSGIKQHKRGSALILVALLLTLGAVVYFASGGSGAIDSVAVLPFVNSGNDPNTEYLSDGISESLINNLSRLPQLKVIARGSSFKYRGKDVDLQEVAKALGVKAIVTGRVIQHGNQLQISAELADTRDKTQMWGEQYNRNATDLQAVQEEIAHIISDKLRLRLTGAQERGLMKRATENSQAYQLYLNGIYYGRKSGSENQGKALDLFNQAIALDPSFALAHANVGLVYTVLAEYGLVDPIEATPKARAAAETALNLDETLAEAHAAMALVENAEWDWPGADSEHRRAIELSPNFAAAHANYAIYLSNMARHAEALTEIKRAQELDPLRVSFKYNEGVILQNARRFDEAITQHQSVIKLQPDFINVYAYLGYTYAAKGMYSEAIAEYQKLISAGGDSTTTQVFLGHADAMSGKRDEALAILDKLKTTKEYVSPAELAILYAGLGDKEEAFAALEKACAIHDPQMQYLKIETHYDSLRSDPRFADLLRKVGLTP